VGLAWEGWEAVVRTFDLRAGEPCEDLAVAFLTPTELKGWDGVGLPPFAVLAARARDRVSALQAAYGGVEPALDFRGLGERARAVRAVAGRLENVQGSRKSARTGQTHPLSGFRARCATQESWASSCRCCGRHATRGLGGKRCGGTGRSSWKLASYWWPGSGVD